ncbi:hypothetical protein [Weissella cibaria]|uniref:hypothetical protein n=1 Tax=Weissella cibaria TaxID=137591 RepID=UPI00106E7AB9|nr:hypothetical protein [Weissella cibaria]MBZ5942916.1 hypothetical protein [Weissella cibaria]MCB5827142.1 hypothetical protein [Weissella cibaria]MCB5858723.1 hypothetical protein [Weissella cibaria]MCB5860932.1 hypothetical protein [Weissella cibaria]MCB5863259.1 hypothetical protein [Weissella cibaria]
MGYLLMLAGMVLGVLILAVGLISLVLGLLMGDGAVTGFALKSIGVGVLMLGGSVWWAGRPTGEEVTQETPVNATVEGGPTRNGGTDDLLPIIGGEIIAHENDDDNQALLDDIEPLIAAEIMAGDDEGNASDYD